MTRIVWTEPSVSDLDNIHSYISRNTPRYTRTRVLTEIFDAVERLAHFPLSGRVVPEVDDENTIEIIVGNYRPAVLTPAETRSAF